MKKPGFYYRVLLGFFKEILKKKRRKWVFQNFCPFKIVCCLKIFIFIRYFFSVICIYSKKGMLKWQRYTISENCPKTSVIVPLRDFKKKIWGFLMQKNLNPKKVLFLAKNGYFWRFLAPNPYLFRVYWAEIWQGHVTTCYLTSLEKMCHFSKIWIP